VSCGDRLCIALNADEDRVPDLHAIVHALRAAYAQLAVREERTGGAAPPAASRGALTVAASA
jgi:hypothetical protein